MLTSQNDLLRTQNATFKTCSWCETSKPRLETNFWVKTRTFSCLTVLFHSCLLRCSSLKAILRIICTSFRTHRYDCFNDSWTPFLFWWNIWCCLVCSLCCDDSEINGTVCFPAMGRRGGDQRAGCHVQVRDVLNVQFFYVTSFHMKQDVEVLFWKSVVTE